MSKHVAVWSVGEFLPGQAVTGLAPERLAELVTLGAVRVAEGAEPATKAAAKPASRRTTATGD